MIKNNITESEDFIAVKNCYTYLSEAVEKLNKKYNLFLYVDFPGKSIVIYDLKKLKTGFEKNKTASFFHESISDKFYKEKFQESDKTKIINSLVQLLISRLGLPKHGIKK